MAMRKQNEYNANLHKGLFQDEDTNIQCKPLKLMPSEEMTLDDRLVEQMSFPERVPELDQGYGAIMLNEVCVTHNVSEAGIKEVT